MGTNGSAKQLRPQKLTIMKAKSYSLAMMATIVLTSVTLAFGQKKASPSALAALDTARVRIEDQAALYKAACTESPALKKYERTVVKAYGEVKVKYGAFKSFIREQTLNGRKVETVAKALRNDKTYLPALQTAMANYKKTLDDVYAKGLKSKPLVSPTGGFDPSALITGLFSAIVEWIQGDLGRKWEERQKLLETLDKPDYTLKEYSEIKAAY